VNEAAIVGPGSSQYRDRDCCPFDFTGDPFSRQLHLYRDEVQVAVFDFYGLSQDSETSQLVLDFRGEMERAARQVWRRNELSTVSPEAAFQITLQQAAGSTQISLNEQRKDITPSIQYTMAGYFGKSTQIEFARLSRLLDWVEYSYNGQNYIKYGNIGYDTGLTLEAKDWAKQSPQYIVDGETYADVIIVTNDAKGGKTDDITGWWPRGSNGELPEPDNKNFVAGIVVDTDVESVGEATAYARRIFELSSTGRGVQTNGSSTLSESFPACLDTLIPGARFNIDLDFGCGDTEATYQLERLQFSVEGGLEAEVKAQFSEVAEV
jgi:hypothetical protein